MHRQECRNPKPSDSPQGAGAPVSPILTCARKPHRAFKLLGTKPFSGPCHPQSHPFSLLHPQLLFLGGQTATSTHTCGFLLPRGRGARASTQLLPIWP